MDPGVQVDKILYALGSSGKYQRIQLALCFLFTLENSFHLIAAVYIGYRPSYQCQDINTTSYLQAHDHNNISDINVQYDKCKINIFVNSSDYEYQYTEGCLNGYSYDIPEDRSTVTEWNLVCSGAERSELAKTMIMLGQAVGAVIFSPIADRFGRKTGSVISRILYFITALATVFTPNIEVFLLFRFLQGTFQGGSVMTNTIMYIEIMPKELRHRSEGLMLTAWTTGLVLTTMIGYLCRNMSWRYMQLILSLLTCHTLFDWLFLDESLRWLVANGKRDQTEKVLKKACRMNNVSYENVTENVLLSKEINIIALEETNELNPGKENGLKKEKVERYTVFTLLKHKRILLGSVVLWIAWITNTLTYYGLMLTTSKLSGDRFLNNVIASLAEYPAVILQQSLINRIGRKSTLVIFHGIAGVSLVLATVCTTYGSEYSWLPILGTVFSFVGRFAITGSFSTVFLYTPELYPTNLRNVGLGMASTVARAGSMMSPFAITLAEYISWGPAAVFATMNVIVTISLLTLPETMGRELPTTITELKDWYKDKGGHGTKAKH
ncbi:solute carrier family 22 member 6-A-like [Mytilus galloprovincialis]|uniref:solute carrier family 22 member 6-A-like n=1 Tax=Mytilus galloprovincialis TaxID=29158 RepID=UPI003F7C8E79